jgi:hypothetical protein
MKLLIMVILCYQSQTLGSSFYAGGFLMLSPGSISRRGAIRSAAAGLTLLAMGVTGEYSANAQQVALEATQRPVNLVIPPNAAPPAPNPRHVF